MNTFLIILSLIIILIAVGLIKQKKERETLSDDQDYVEPKDDGKKIGMNKKDVELPILHLFL